MGMIAFDKTEAGLLRAYNFPKLWAMKWQKSSPRFLVSNPHVPRLCFTRPVSLTHCHFSLILSSLDISSLQCQYSLSASLVRIKDDFIFEPFYKIKPTCAQGNTFWTEWRTLPQRRGTSILLVGGPSSSPGFG